MNDDDIPKGSRVPEGGVLTRCGEDDRVTQGAAISAVGRCMGEVNMAARVAAANPLRPTPAIPAAPPDLVSNSGDTTDREGEATIRTERGSSEVP